jgi:SAM-dependent methyltransferase
MHRLTSDVYGMAPSQAEDYSALRLDVIRQRWDEKAQRWDRDLADEDFHLNEDGAYVRFLAAAAAALDERADFCRRHALVDLACGTGLVLAHFIGRFAGGVGIDLSPRMLEMAQRRRLPTAQFLLGNCFELARLAPRAGAVLSRGILLSHYGRKWAPALLGQVRETLVPDGGFAMLDFLNASARHLYPSNPENKTYFRADELELLGNQCGFRRASTLGEPERRVRLLLLER